MHHARRQAVLNLFCSKGDRSSKLRRAIVDVLANGDFDGDVLVHWCNGCCTSAADCMHKMQTYFLAALVGACPRVLARSRWTGHADSVGYYGLLESVYRLFSKTFARFANRLGGDRDCAQRPWRTTLAMASLLVLWCMMAGLQMVRLQIMVWTLLAAEAAQVRLQPVEMDQTAFGKNASKSSRSTARACWTGLLAMGRCRPW